MGVTMQLPEADRHTYTKGYLETQVAVLMGGRVAEELFMNHMTSGASNDIERATDIAQHMVCEWGMSALGMRAFRKAGSVFDGDRTHAMSEATARRVDEEIEKIIAGGYETARLFHFLGMISFVLFFLLHFTQVIRAGWDNFRAMVAGFGMSDE